MEFDRRNFLSVAGKGLGLAALSSPTIASLVKEIHAATSVAHLTPKQAAKFARSSIPFKIVVMNLHAN
jgi:hypothetical protein